MRSVGLATYAPFFWMAAELTDLTEMTRKFREILRTSANFSQNGSRSGCISLNFSVSSSKAHVPLIPDRNALSLQLPRRGRQHRPPADHVADHPARLAHRPVVVGAVRLHTPTGRRRGPMNLFLSCHSR
jgi:hypothetical protein